MTPFSNLILTGYQNIYYKKQFDLKAIDIQSMLMTPPLEKIYIREISPFINAPVTNDCTILSHPDNSHDYIALGVGLILAVLAGFGLHYVMSEGIEGIIGGTSGTT
jgi:hypothetical protein